jgi:hypothetical protein
MKSDVSILKAGRENASLSSCSMLFILKPWRWKQQVYPKRSQVSVLVHGNTPFIVTAAQPAVSLQKRIEHRSTELLVKLPMRITFMVYINVSHSSSIRRPCAPYPYKNTFCAPITAIPSTTIRYSFVSSPHRTRPANAKRPLARYEPATT